MINIEFFEEGSAIYFVRVFVHVVIIIGHRAYDSVKSFVCTRLTIHRRISYIIRLLVYRAREGYILPLDNRYGRSDVSSSILPRCDSLETITCFRTTRARIVHISTSLFLTIDKLCRQKYCRILVTCHLDCLIIFEITTQNVPSFC